MASVATLDEARIDAFFDQLVEELGATIGAALVVIGDKLGLYRSMALSGAVTPGELAEHTGTSERYVREWLGAQAAAGHVEYDPDERTYTLPPEHAYVLANENSPYYVGGEPMIREAFRSGAGVGWHEHSQGVFEGCERFHRSVYAANLVSSWILALEDVERKLHSGATVADVGCGHGASTILMANAYPSSRFVGFDYHGESIATAHIRAAEAGLNGRVRFDVAPAAEYPGWGYDLVCTFDCLHAMGDPVGAARHVRESLHPEGTWLIVEPVAGDRVEDNLDPIGRIHYGVSTLLSTPASLAQEVGLALGAQAGESRLRAVAASGGFTRFRRVAETPFSLVFEARP